MKTVKWIVRRIFDLPYVFLMIPTLLVYGLYLSVEHVKKWANS